MNAIRNQLEYLATRVRLMDRLLIEADAQRTMLLEALQCCVDSMVVGGVPIRGFAAVADHARGVIDQVKGSR